ncbi:MAG: hypothetical protein ACE5LX_06800 [Nitrospinota bacterium]
MTSAFIDADALPGWGRVVKWRDKTLHHLGIESGRRQISRLVKLEPWERGEHSKRLPSRPLPGQVAPWERWDMAGVRCHEDRVVRNKGAAWMPRPGVGCGSSLGLLSQAISRPATRSFRLAFGETEGHEEPAFSHGVRACAEGRA